MEAAGGLIYCRMDWRDGLEQQSKGEWETVEAEDSKALKWSSVEGVP